MSEYESDKAKFQKPVPAYEAHQRFLHDQATDIEEAHEKGVAKVARNMKQKGCDIAFITEMTGLSSVEINKLS